MEKPKIYIVTIGSYEDYEIEAVFTDKAMAEDYADAQAGRRIEEWIANDKVAERKECWYEVAIPTVPDKEVQVSDVSAPCDTVHFSGNYYWFSVLTDGVNSAKEEAMIRYREFLKRKDTDFPLINKQCLRGAKYPCYSYNDRRIWLEGDIRTVYKEIVPFLSIPYYDILGTKASDTEMLHQLKEYGVSFFRIKGRNEIENID